MKYIFLIIFLINTSSFLAKGQSMLHHGIGANIGIKSKQDKSFSIEYEMNILNNKSDYLKGYIVGIGGSKTFGNGAEYAGYFKGGYRLSTLSFGINAGAGSDTPRLQSTKAKALYGAWLGINIIKALKIEVGGDSFNGFKIGLVYFPNTIRSNR